MKNPRIEVDLAKLRENIQELVDKMVKHGLSITAVTKVFEACPEMVAIYEEFSEIAYFGDSRLENLISYADSKKKKIMIRIPMESEVAEVVRYADISFNSELATIRKLNEAAKKQQRKHEIVLMVDLGDLREGFFSREELYQCIEETQRLEYIQIIGLGANLTCYGAIIPDSKNLSQLAQIQMEVQERFGLTFEMISGGNSSSLYLLDDTYDFLPKEINNLRIGEAFVLGRETAYGTEYPELHQDVFTLKAELVELKQKPSFPIGKIGVDAFGHKPHYEDKGEMLRGIVAIGKQDVSLDDIQPLDSRITLLGSSSDHLILDMTEVAGNYQVGDEIAFSLSYGSVLSTFTSKYVKKDFKPN